MIDFKTYFFGKDENRCLEDDSFIPIWKPCAAVLVVCACRQPCDLVFHLWWIALSVGDLLALARLPACFFFVGGKGKHYIHSVFFLAHDTHQSSTHRNTQTHM